MLAATYAVRINMRLLTDLFFLTMFFVLLGVWLVAWLAFHVASGGIHILLGIAVLCLIVHLMRGTRTA